MGWKAWRIGPQRAVGVEIERVHLTPDEAHRADLGSPCCGDSRAWLLWSVYVRREDGRAEWQKDYRDEADAIAFARRLAAECEL